MTSIGGQQPGAGGGATSPAGLSNRECTLTRYGTQRRLQALMACGWSVPGIARATGMRPLQLTRALEHSASITPNFATDVSVAYDKLWDQQPVLRNEADRELAAVSARLARQHGWPPPLAWDDDEIDKPDSRPAEGWQPSPRKSRRSADLVEDMQFVRSAGGSRAPRLRLIAERFGVSKNVLEHAISRQRAAEDRGQQLELG